MTKTAVLKRLSSDKKYRDLKIGQAVKEKRESLKLSQRELASIMKVSRTTISEWETGKGIANRHLGKIKEFLSFDPYSPPYKYNSVPIPDREDLKELVKEIVVGVELLVDSLLELSRIVLFGDQEESVRAGKDA